MILMLLFAAGLSYFFGVEVAVIFASGWICGTFYVAFVLSCVSETRFKQLTGILRDRERKQRRKK